MRTQFDIDSEGLAAAIRGMDEDDDSFHEELHERFGCSLLQFEDLIAELLVMIDVGTSPLTGNRYKGFNKDGVFLAKVKV